MSPQATEEVSYRIAVSFDGRKNGTNITSSVIRLAGDAGCHPPLEGRDLSRVDSSLTPAEPCCCPPGFRSAELLPVEGAKKALLLPDDKRSVLHGAGDEARTRYLDLGKVALYQMSYTRGTFVIIA